MYKLKLGLGGLLLAMPYTAWALFGDSVRPYASYSVSHDSNYFRVNASQAQALLGSSNTAVTTRNIAAGVDTDLKFSRQTVLLRANVNQSNFDRPELQSQNGRSFNADWQWIVGNQWNGNLSYLQSRELQTQTDSLTAQASVRDRKDLSFSANYLLHPSFSLQADIRQSRSEYSPDSRAILNLEENTVGLGFRFMSRAGNQIGLRLQQINGRYVNRPAPLDQYQQSEISLQGDWQPDGHTRLHAQVGETRRDENQSTQRSPSWRFSLDWTPGGASSLSAYASRQITASDSLTTAVSSVSSMQGLSGNWQLSAKTVLNAALSTQTLDYSSIARQDKTRTANLGLSYQPSRNISVGLTYEIGQRDSSLVNSDYRYRQVIANIRGSF